MVSVSIANHRNLVLSVWVLGPHGLDLDLPHLQSLIEMKAKICVCSLWTGKVGIYSVLNI